MRLPSSRLDLLFFCQDMPANAKNQVFGLKGIVWKNAISCTTVRQTRSEFQTLIFIWNLEGEDSARLWPTVACSPCDVCFHPDSSHNRILAPTSNIGWIETHVCQRFEMNHGSEEVSHGSI
jgi:hypothetical protein